MQSRRKDLTDNSSRKAANQAIRARLSGGTPYRGVEADMLRHVRSCTNYDTFLWIFRVTVAHLRLHFLRWQILEGAPDANEDRFS